MWTKKHDKVSGKPYHDMMNALHCQQKELEHKEGAMIQYVYCTYCSWRKGTSQDDTMSNSEETPKPFPLLSYAWLKAIS